MTHLNLNQTTSSIEVVASSIIDKLYELAQNPSLDANSTLQGNLQCTHAYEDEVTYLLNKFPGLQINVTGGLYIRFADNAVATICASNWGDGSGITNIQAIAVSNLGTKFSNNTNIVSFNELSKFINVKTLYYQEFRNCTNLTSIDLSNVTNLNDSAFSGCTKLVTIGSLQNLVSIQNYAFLNCPITGELSLPNLTGKATGFAYTNITKVLNLGSCTDMNYSDTFHYNQAAFAGCPNLIEITLPDTMLSIGGMSACHKLITVNFNSNVTHIYQSAFTDDILLTTIGDCSNIITIDSSAFSGCLMLQNINLSLLCNTIASAAFKNCKALSSVGDLSSLTVVNSDTFNGCLALISVNLSSTCKTLNNNCFNGCVSLTNVGDLSNVTSIGSNAFQNCSKLATVNISNKCTSIGNVGFRDCVLLTTIGDTTGLTTVSDYCFYGCTLLDKFELGVNCTSIGNNCFANCTHLRYLKINGTSVVLNYISALTNTTCKIYVPDDSVASYKAATNWSTYASRIFSLTQFAIDFPNG